MRKLDSHMEDLKLLLTKYVHDGKTEEFFEYLMANCNLPGRRANLELAQAFSDLVLKQEDENLVKIKKLIEKLLAFSSEIAPTNDKREFYAFCGTCALGALGLNENYSNFVYSNLKLMAKDNRWRIREAVAKAIKILAQNDRDKLIKELRNWLKEEKSWLIMRAIAAGMAESLVSPSVMEDKSFAIESLKFHKQIFKLIQTRNERNSEEFKNLKKGLGYTLSVVIQAVPEEGFKYIKNLISLNDTDILWIIGNNLKKNRLIKQYPKQVIAIKNLLK